MRHRGRARVLFLVGVYVAIFLIPATGMAQTLVWSPSSGQVDGYKVFYNTTPSNQSNFLDVGNTTQCDLNILPLSEGVTYYISISAYNAVGESPPCTPVVFTPGDSTPPLPPMGLTTE